MMRWRNGTLPGRNRWSLHCAGFRCSSGYREGVSPGVPKRTHRGRYHHAVRASGIDEHVGRVLGQRYRLVAPIGSGASARVYIAEDQSLHRRVAVKLLHPGLAADARFARRFESEARSSAQLNHPHVLAVYDWSDSDPAYLVSELLDGGSLRSVLDTGALLSPSQALMVGLQAAQGLAYAHRRGLVHRDIKPANLLFDLEGRLRIADFGIARAVVEAAWTEPEGALIGTARYAAPEQASTAVVDGRADVYGLALSMVEAVTGEVPLVASTALATMLLRQDTDLEAPSELGPLRRVLDAAGRADPAERLDAATFARALHHVASELPRPRRLELVPLAMEDVPEANAVEEARHDEARHDKARHDKESDTIIIEDPAIDLRQADGVSDATTQMAVTADLSSMATSVHPAISVDGQLAAPDDDVDREVDGRDDDDDDVVEVEDFRRRWPFALLLALLVGAAGFVYANREVATESLGDVFAEPTHPMGTFVGRDIADVERDIELNNWLVDVTDTVRQDDSVAGEVLSQSPQPGIEYEEGLTVTLVVSAGPELRVVPVLEGATQVEAEATIRDLDLVVGEVTTVADEDIEAGIVMSASVEPETELEPGEVIDLVVSSGPAPRTVPRVAGLDQAAARADLEALGLVFVPAEEHSREVAEGDVISVSPEEGSEVSRGAEITVVYSLGRPFVTVPDVRGLSAAEAADQLQAAGFVVRDTEGPPNSEVLATNPPAGETLREGTSIIIFTR